MIRSLKYPLLFALGLAAFISTLQGFKNSLAMSQDFQWSPTRILSQNLNPYEVWLEGNKGGDIILSQIPNYLHHLYVVLLPLGIIDFAAAKFVWGIINILLAATVSFALASHWNLSRSAALIVFSLFLCSTPFRNTLGNGQHALFVLAFIIIPFTKAIPCINLNSRHLLQGMGYAKYSFAPPFFLYSIFRWGPPKAALGLVLPLLGLGIFCLLTGANPVNAWFLPLRVASGAVGLGAADMMSVAEVIFGKNIILSGLISLIFSVLLTWIVVRHWNVEAHLPLLAMVALVTFKHLPYDFVFLLPTLAYSLKLNYRIEILFIWIGIGWFWFAERIITAIFNYVGVKQTIFQIPFLFTNFFILVAMILLLMNHRSVKEVTDDLA